MTEEIIKVESSLTLGTADTVANATAIANELAKIINTRKLYSVISKKKFVRVEGWTTLGAMVGVLPREVSTIRHDNGTYESIVELIRVVDGEVIGRGSAICGIDEKTWGKREEYARRSMAITRATGKAYRLGFSWIITLAGFEATPAEEMPRDSIEGEYREAQPRMPRKPINGNRPYTPAIVRQKLIEKSATYPEFDPSDKQLNLLRYGLELCFVGEDAVEDKRHTVLNYFIGSTSTKDASGPQFKAIIEDWLAMEKSDDDSGEYTVNEYAIQEAHAIFTESLKDEGQAELGV
jgi:hypothetical protein